MGVVCFSFGTARNESNANNLLKKIDYLLEEFNLSSEEFFDEILTHADGFFVSSSNMNRTIETITKENGYEFFKIQNFFFRLRLDNYANNLLKNNTVLLKGNLIIHDNLGSCYFDVRDFYLVKASSRSDHELLIPGTADYRNGKKDFSEYNESINLNLALEVPFIANQTKFKQFVSNWRRYLEFEKQVTIRTMKQYPIIGNVNFTPVREVGDNATNRIDYKNHIIEKGHGNLYVSLKSPKLEGDEREVTILSMKIDGRLFGNKKEEIEKNTKNFARLGLSIIGAKSNKALDLLIEELKRIDERGKRGNEIDEIRGLDFDDWLPPLYDLKSGDVTFSFLVDEGDEPSENIVKKYGEKLFLAYTATGDIALYKRGKDALDRIESGDVKNPYLAGFIIEPKAFESGRDSFNEENVKFALEKELNADQKKAVIKCLNSSSIFLLQGPPGTGKTQTISELVYQFNKMGKKVLLSSQAHVAIDNVIERILRMKELDILPIRLVRNNSRANKLYWPDKLLDNLYEAAYGKYKGKIDAYETYENNINQLLKNFSSNESRYENIKARLAKVEATERKRDRLREELSNIYSQKNEKESKQEEILRSLSVFEHYRNTKLKFESVCDEHVYEPLIDPIRELAEKYKIEKEDDFSNYVATFKERAGRSRIDRLTSLLNGCDTPEEIISIAKGIESLEEKKRTFEEYGQKCPENLIKEINDKLQKKKNIDRKYESSGAKSIDLNDEKLYFRKKTGNAKKDLEGELKGIEDFVKQYDEILSKTFDKDNYDLLSDKKYALEDEIKSADTNISILDIKIKNLIEDIKEQNAPIWTERKQLDEYFVSFYTDKLNGVALPETETKKFAGIRKYIKEEKQKFEEYKADFKKLQNIYTSLSTYLEDRKLFVSAQRSTYTNELLKRNANVFGITCTSNPFFDMSKIFSEGDENAAPINIENVDIRRMDFDVVIIDEVSKATPIEMLIPIVYGKSVVLVGDQRQLPPIFKYRDSTFNDRTPEEKKGMLQGWDLSQYREMVESSLFEEMFNDLSRNRAMLTKQYRFNESIMKCVNIFYDGKLKLGAGQEQNNKRQHYLDISVSNFKEQMVPIFCRNHSTYWFDSQKWADGSIAYAERRDDESSYRNPLEVCLTIELLLLLEKGYGDLKKENPEEYKMATSDGKMPSVAVLSMYGKHISSIRDELRARKIETKNFKNIRVDISTVDNYQGREQDIVLINMVDNNKNGEPSKFLRKFNRINVAISRARTMLIMVGSKDYYNNVKVNVPKMDSGEDNYINAYYQIYDECQSKWVNAAKILGVKKNTNNEENVNKKEVNKK